VTKGKTVYICSSARHEKMADGGIAPFIHNLRHLRDVDGQFHAPAILHRGKRS
jgi:hypothetical protein